jgi:hypothetical protein
MTGVSGSSQMKGNEIPNTKHQTPKKSLAII